MMTLEMIKKYPWDRTKINGRSYYTLNASEIAREDKKCIDSFHRVVCNTLIIIPHSNWDDLIKDVYGEDFNRKVDCAVPQDIYNEHHKRSIKKIFYSYNYIGDVHSAGCSYGDIMNEDSIMLSLYALLRVLPHERVVINS